MRTDAVISPCGTWRYALSRQWDDDLSRLPFIMLNPSTADASLDDPTIRRCMGFARREGFGGIYVANLFAYRSPNPEDVVAAGGRAVGPDNDRHLLEVLARAVDAAVPIVCAWGASLPGHLGRALWVKRNALGVGADLRCLGATKEGHPRHPLYVKGDQPLVRFA